jgi:hypothetical protein
VIAEPLGGDLDVVQIPERLSKRQRELYEQLRALEKRGGR